MQATSKGTEALLVAHTTLFEIPCYGSYNSPFQLTQLSVLTYLAVSQFPREYVQECILAIVRINLPGCLSVS